MSEPLLLCVDAFLSPVERVLDPRPCRVSDSWKQPAEQSPRHMTHTVTPNGITTHMMAVSRVFCTGPTPSSCRSFIHSSSAFSHLRSIFVEPFACVFISLCCQVALEFQGSSCPSALGCQKSEDTCRDHPCPAPSIAFLQVIPNFLLQLVQQLLFLKHSEEPYLATE